MPGRSSNDVAASVETVPFLRVDDARPAAGPSAAVPEALGTLPRALITTKNNPA
jgi:hypothetical protein